MPLRTPQTPRRRRARATAVAIGVAAFAVVGLGGCGRSAPVDALGDGDGGDPDIAGVSVTSPDAVVSPEPGAAVEAPAGPTSTAVVVDTEADAPVGSTYVVQPGDTLWDIATNFDITIDELAAANALVDVHSIAPGQQLVIPARPVEVSVVDTNATSTIPPTAPPSTTPSSTLQQP